MPSNGSRHHDDELGAARPEPRVRDLRGSRADDSGQGADERGADARSASEGSDADQGAANQGAANKGGGNEGGARIPNVFEEVSPDLTTGLDMPEELVTLTKERDELLDALRRTQADFENYKKRVERQSAEIRDRANERIVEAMLPALDAFSMARSHLGEGVTSPESKALLQAASLFEAALEKEGLERIDADGVDFDPTSHEAVEHLPAEEGDAASGPDGASGAARASGGGPVVTGVLRPGYVWKGRVVRPAMVRVRG